MGHERLPFNADTEGEVWQYYCTRALQALASGYQWSGQLTRHEGGFITSFVQTMTGDQYWSFFIPHRLRGKGHGPTLLRNCPGPILTTHECDISAFLRDRAHPFTTLDSIFNSAEYRMVQSYYGNSTPNRTPAFKMNHIDEGLVVLKTIGADYATKRAYCLHPMLQSTNDLCENFATIAAACDPLPVHLALEYRNIANQYLSTRHVQSVDEIALSLPQVTKMLIADKVQNYKDFITYHKSTHPRSIELSQYFNNWLTRLTVPPCDFNEMVNNIMLTIPTQPNIINSHDQHSA